MEWQPLETIPKDGTRVELLSANGETDFGNWYDFNEPGWAKGNAWWTPSIPGVFTGDLNTDNGLGDYTHWKSLDT
jgi:hypothetical protein